MRFLSSVGQLENFKYWLYLLWCTVIYIDAHVHLYLKVSHITLNRSLFSWIDYTSLCTFLSVCVFFVFNSHIRCWINCKFINVEEICKMLFFMKYLNNFTASFCKLSQTTRVFQKREGVGISNFFRTKARNAAQTERF